MTAAMRTGGHSGGQPATRRNPPRKDATLPGPSLSGDLRFKVPTVLEAIGRHGPVTLGDLTRMLPFKRLVIWRVCDMLRVYGWVRMTLAGEAFELTHRLDHLGGDFHFAASDISDVEPVLRDILALGAFEVECGRLRAFGQYEILDRSCGDAPNPGDRSLFDDPMALAAQLAESPARLARHVRAALDGETGRDGPVIDHGTHLKRLRAHADAGVIWFDRPQAAGFALPWRGTRESAVAIGVWTQSNSARNRSGLRDCMRFLHKRYPEQTRIAAIP